MNSGLHVQPAWEELLERLAPPTGTTGSTAAPLALHVLGGMDTGKSTFCSWLGHSLAARELKVAAVDCDPGQGRIGPPATVGLGWIPPDDDAPSALRFVGDVSPAGHFLQLTVGIGALDRHARMRGAEAVVFDASGFMDTPAGREYHTLLIEATVAVSRDPHSRAGPDNPSGPDDPPGPATPAGRRAGHLVAIQRNDELEPVLRAFDRRTDVEVHRLRMSPAVEPRSRAQRRHSRDARFQRHFADAERVSLPLGGRGLQGRVPSLKPGRELRGLLVSPLDEAGFALGPHLLRAIEYRGGERVLQLIGPRLDPARVTSVQFGSMRLESLEALLA